MHAGSSSLTRDWTRAPCIGRTESYPVDHQGGSQLHSWLQGMLSDGSLKPTFVTSALCFWDVVGIFARYTELPSPLFSTLPLKWTFQNADLTLLYPCCHACGMLLPPQHACFISPTAVTIIHTVRLLVVHISSMKGASSRVLGRVPVLGTEEAHTELLAEWWSEASSWTEILP